MNKKEIAKTFLQMAGSGEVESAFERYIHPQFRHHNQWIKGDRQSLLEGMRDSYAETPNKSIETKMVFEDGDTVITYSRVNRKSPDQPAIAVVHMFRFEGEKIIEMWDLGQPIQADSPNTNGIF